MKELLDNPILLLAVVGLCQLILTLMLSHRITKVAKAACVEITFFGGVKSNLGKQLAKDLRRELHLAPARQTTTNPYTSPGADC